jgi:hypothetical protein
MPYQGERRRRRKGGHLEITHQLASYTLVFFRKVGVIGGPDTICFLWHFFTMTQARKIKSNRTRQKGPVTAKLCVLATAISATGPRSDDPRYECSGRCVSDRDGRGNPE